MKKAFTMIELIFVIVILGILAAVAVPKLAATRDDATLTKIAANFMTLYSDLGAYYTANGKWPIGNPGHEEDEVVGDWNSVKKNDKLAQTVKKMSLVPSVVSYSKEGSSEACVYITALAQERGRVKFEFNTNNHMCRKLWELPGIKNIVNGPGRGELPGGGFEVRIYFGGTEVNF